MLQARANADLAVYSKPTEQWSMNMLAGEEPGIAAIQLGSTARLYFRDHGWIDDGWRNLRIIGFSSDMSERVPFSVQPVGGA